MIGLKLKDPAFVARVQSSVLDTTVTDWIARVAVNGGVAPSAGTISAADTWVKGCITAGLRTKIKLFNFYSRGNWITARTPLIQGPGPSLWTNLGSNFVSGDLSINGFTGAAGKTFRLDGATPSAIWSSRSNVGLHLYNFTMNNAAHFDCGRIGGSNDYLALTSNYTDNQTRFYCCDNTGDEIKGASNNLGGFYSCNRISTTDARIYFANSTHAIAQIAVKTSLMTTNFTACSDMYVFSMGLSDGTAYQPFTGTMSAVIFTDGLSIGDAGSLYNLTQALNVSLGGGFV